DRVHVHDLERKAGPAEAVADRRLRDRGADAMSKRPSTGTWLLVAALAAGLAATGVASAAINPIVQAQSDLNGNTTITYAQSSADDGAATIQFTVPDSYLATFSHPEGALVGTVTGKAVVIDAGSATVPLTGQINAAIATTAMANGSTVGAAAAACDPHFAAH